MQDFPGARDANAGCVQSDACVTCLNASDSYSGKHAWRAGEGCNASCYPDGAVADEIVRRLDVAASHPTTKQPFFLAAGFKRPHLGWMAPKVWFDMYDNRTIDIATHRDPPKDMPDVAFGTNGEMCGMDDVRCEKDARGFPIVPDARKHEEYRKAYYAVVSFMDAQVGRVLDALDRTGLSNSTAVIFWGDRTCVLLSFHHTRRRRLSFRLPSSWIVRVPTTDGYQLGEHGLWGKVTNFELATRVPLIVSLPHHPLPGSIVSDAIVSLLDVFPTALDIAGLAPVRGNEGRSLVSLLDDPTNVSRFNVSFSQFGRGEIMGLSMRTSRYRLTRWGAFNFSSGSPCWNDDNASLELYDHTLDDGLDFDAYENINVANDPEYSATLIRLQKQLQENWDSVLE